jgi:general secretion pathway protein D
LVPILRPLVPPQGHLAAYPQSNVLIVSDRAANIHRLMEIIKRVDQPSSGEIEIVPLENAVASDLVRVLTALQQQTGAKGAQAGDRPMLVADERTNSILIGGDKSMRLQLRAIISHLDTPSEVTGDTHVVYLRYAKAKDLVPVLTGVGDSQKEQGGKKVAGRPTASRTSKLFDIQADENTNALVITAPPTVFRSLEAVIRQLDIRRAQVMVEAIIAEVSSDRAAELGVQWLFDGSGGDNPVGAVNFGGSGTSISSIASAGVAAGGASAGVALSAIGSGLTLGAGEFASKTFNFAGLIRALEGDGSTNVLSTPNLVTMDNEEAEIFVGQELSIPTGSFTSTGGASSTVNPFTTFERKQVGIRLKVKPQINEGDAIRLEIEQSVDGISAGSAGSGDIVTSQRSLNTSVLVDDGKALVLGGLIKDDLVETEQKVPLLGDVPLLGALFRYKSVQKVKTNLMIFLRPIILRSKDDSLNITRSKYNFIRSKQLALEERGVGLLSEETQPMLLPAEDFLELPPPFEEKEMPPSSPSSSSAPMAPQASAPQTKADSVFEDEEAF